MPVGGSDPGHYVLSLDDGVVLGDALAAIAAAGLQVHSCRERRSELEDAFRFLTEDGL